MNKKELIFNIHPVFCNIFACSKTHSLLKNPTYIQINISYPSKICGLKSFGGLEFNKQQNKGKTQSHHEVIEILYVKLDNHKH